MIINKLIEVNPKKRGRPLIYESDIDKSIRKLQNSK